VQVIPQNAPETVWRPGSAWTCWGAYNAPSILIPFY